MQESIRLRHLRKELNPREKSIVTLEDVYKDLKSQSSREFAISLISKYRASGFLTDKQWCSVKSLLCQYKSETRKKGPSLIYVIECEEFVRIGISDDVEYKLKDAQETISENANILYEQETGYTNKAKSIERKIRRFCNEYHISDEWFMKDVLPKVHKFFSTIEKKHKLPAKRDNESIVLS